MPPEEFVRRIQEAGQLGAVYSDVRRSKALIAAVAAATVTDESGGPVDLSDLIGSADESDEQVDAEQVDVEGASEADPAAVETAEESADADEAADDVAGTDGAGATEAEAPVQPEGGRAASDA